MQLICKGNAKKVNVLQSIFKTSLPGTSIAMLHTLTRYTATQSEGPDIRSI